MNDIAPSKVANDFANVLPTATNTLVLIAGNLTIFTNIKRNALVPRLMQRESDEIEPCAPPAERGRVDSNFQNFSLTQHLS